MIKEINSAVKLRRRIDRRITDTRKNLKCNIPTIRDRANYCFALVVILDDSLKRVAHQPRHYVSRGKSVFTGWTIGDRGLAGFL